MRDTLLALTSALALLAACDSAKFTGAPAAAAKLSTNPPSGDAQGDSGAVYSFGLKIGSGAPVVAKASQPAVPSVYLNGSTTPLAGAELAAWQAAVYLDGATPGPLGDVAGGTLDLSQSTGTLTVHANFAQTTDKRTGTAVASVFVDGEAPKATLLRLASSQSGDSTQVFWSATDNYRVNEDLATLIACSSVLADFAPKTHADLDTLPDGCVLVYKGADLYKQPPQMNLSAVEIDGNAVLPAQVHYALYVEDMVGLSAFTWITEPAGIQDLLTLTTTPAAVQYTKVRQVPVQLQLSSMLNGATKQIDAAANSAAWPNYQTTLTTTSPVSSNTAAFNPALPLTLPAAEGLYSYNVQVAESTTGSTSNRKTLVFVLDTTPPVVNNIHVDVPGGILNAQATVNLSWAASDANGIASQTVEIMQTGDAGYTQIGSIAGSQTTFSFPWGSRPNKGFVIRITALDPAGNAGLGVSKKWTPQVFNAAVLTQSVQCYFCHAKIVGDLGGIGFPADAQIRSDSGQNFNITGNIYGTTGVPTALGTKTAGTIYTNYANDIYKIFPKNNQFPVVTAAALINTVNGSLRLNTLFINRVYQGNLILDGTQTNQPIQLSGEVFINGDVILKGAYTGVGTIYANNIYVVGDLIALNSPFPFDDDPTKATAQAVAAVAAKTDALYLGSLNQAVIGGLQTNLTDESGQYLTNTDPFSWISLAAYNALGSRAVKMKDTAGVARDIHASWIPDPTDVTNPRADVEVNRVDAYVYAQTVVMWRAYANILLNGGFMSPRGGIVSTVPYSMFNFSAQNNFVLANNPRNGMSPLQNVIRYDYRLRTGGPGFETIKTFFDQQ